MFSSQAGGCGEIANAVVAARLLLTINTDPLIVHSMSQMAYEFLPGVPSAHVLGRLSAAGGNEVGSGKLASPQSSADLAVNTFGWFIERPELLPPFSTVKSLEWPALKVEVEFCARFPWSGGKHPWLDAWIETSSAVIGVESKRFEPYRDRKRGAFSDAYDRPVWHDQMGLYERLKNRLRSRDEQFQYLDAVQLVKHAFGLVTEGRRKQKRPYLLYLFAEPEKYLDVPIPEQSKQNHRAEIDRFAEAVRGAEVQFAASSYREWLESWPEPVGELVRHRNAILERFQP